MSAGLILEFKGSIRHVLSFLKKFTVTPPFRLFKTHVTHVGFIQIVKILKYFYHWISWQELAFSLHFIISWQELAFSLHFMCQCHHKIVIDVLLVFLLSTIKKVKKKQV